MSEMTDLLHGSASPGKTYEAPKKGTPMNEQHLLDFLDQLLVDSEGDGTPVENRPGWVVLEPAFLPEPDHCVRAYSALHPFCVHNSDEDVGAYDVSLVAMRYLRECWRSGARDLVEAREGNPSEVLASMSSDVASVIAFLSHYKVALERLRLGTDAFGRRAEEAREAQEKAKGEVATAAHMIAVEESFMALAAILERTPTEQLAAAGQGEE